MSEPPRLFFTGNSLEQAVLAVINLMETPDRRRVPYTASAAVPIR